MNEGEHDHNIMENHNSLKSHKNKYKKQFTFKMDSVIKYWGLRFS